MNSLRRKILWAGAGVGAGLLCACFMFAQPAASEPSSPKSNPAFAETPVSPSPVLKSPVDLFRELLAMDLAERKEYLADRTPEDQRRILAKVREYESLKPDKRELRLRATELRWYLLPLMTAPPTNRPAQLATIPAEQRKLIEDRLRAWDKLPADVQKELLENEFTIGVFAQPESNPESSKQVISPARRQKLEAGIAWWGALSEPKHRELLDRFNQFFNLTPKEKQKALNTISEAERRQMEKTLRAFGKLPKAQRAQCIQSFAKFARMSVEERQQFLKNAERWRLMSPDERQAWRELVSKLPEVPPTPPGLDSALPPSLPGLSQPQVTNKN
jgi:hypothetical protein